MSGLTGPFTRLPRPPNADNFRDWQRWFEQLYLILSSDKGIGSDVVATELDALTTGMVAKTATGTYAARTITGTTGETEVSNGNGVSGNPVVGLPTTISGPRRFGGDTNYTEFEEDGTMVAKGAATCFRDELGDATKLKVVGVGITLDDAEGTVDFATTANLADYVWINYQLNHDWVAGTVVYPHIHYWQKGAATPNFLLEYRWQVNGGAKTTTWMRLIAKTQAFTYVSGTLNQIAATASGISAPSPYGISDILQIRLYRDNANTSTLFAGNDTHTGDAEVLAMDVHVECDTLGSRTQYTK